jgi:hypothetical protein
LPGDENNRVIFELQSVDWPSNTPIDSGELRDTLRMLQSLGIGSEILSESYEDISLPLPP